MIKSLWLTLSVVLIATSVSAMVTPMPDYMKILEANPDDTVCWQAFDGFMSSGHTDDLPMIFTTEESQVAGRSGSPMCQARLFGLKSFDLKDAQKVVREKLGEKVNSLTNKELSAAVQVETELLVKFVEESNPEIKANRAAFREKLLAVANAGNPIAQEYVRKAFAKRLAGFRVSEIGDVGAFTAMIASWPEEVKVENKEDLLRRFISENKFAQIKDLALELADGDSEYARRIVLEGIFEGLYGGKFMPLQGRALELLEKYAQLGSVKAFEIMRAKISIPQIKAIAIKPEIIRAAEMAGIDSAVGGWEGFLRAKGIIE